MRTYNTPLHLAIARGELETVEVLLSVGADPNADGPSAFRGRPLHLAAARADAEATEALSRARADPNTQGLLHFAIEHDALFFTTCASAASTTSRG